MALKRSKSEEEREEGRCLFTNLDEAVRPEEGEENVSLTAVDCTIVHSSSSTLPLMPLHRSNQQQPHQSLITQAVLADVLKGGTWVGSGSCASITVSLQTPISSVHTAHNTQTQAEHTNAQPEMDDMPPAFVFPITIDLPTMAPTSPHASSSSQNIPTPTSLAKRINHTTPHTHSPPVPSLLNPHITHPPSTPRLPPTPYWRDDPAGRRVEPKLWETMVHRKAARIRAMWRASLREEGKDGGAEGEREREKRRGVPSHGKGKGQGHAQRKAKHSHPFAGRGPVRTPPLTVLRAHSAPPSLPSLSSATARLRGGAEPVSPSVSVSASVSASGLGTSSTSASVSTSPPALGTPRIAATATATTPATPPRPQSDDPGPRPAPRTQNTPPPARRDAYTAELLRGARPRAHASLAAGSLLRHLGLGDRVFAPLPPPRSLVVVVADGVSVVQPATRPEVGDGAAGSRPAGVPDVGTPYPAPVRDKDEEDVSMEVDDAEEQEVERRNGEEGTETEEGELGDLMYVDDEEEEGEVRDDEDQEQEGPTAAAVFVREAGPSPSPPSSPTLRASSPGHALAPDLIDIDIDADSETEVETEIEVDELPDEVFTDSEAESARVPAYRARPKAPPRTRKRKRSLEENIPPAVHKNPSRSAKRSALNTSSSSVSRSTVAPAHAQAQPQPPRPIARRVMLQREHAFVPRTSTIRTYVPDQSKAVTKARQCAVRESRDAIKRPAKDSPFNAPLNQGQGEASSSSSSSSSSRRALPETSHLALSIVDEWRAALQRFFAYLQALDVDAGTSTGTGTGAGRHPQQKAQREALASAQRAVGELEDNRHLLNVALIVGRPWAAVRAQSAALVEGGQWARGADEGWARAARDVLRRVGAVMDVFEARVRAERARLARL